MKLFIPELTTKMELVEPWTFSFYMEDRNNKLLGELLTYGFDIKKPKKDSDGRYELLWIAALLGPVTFPTGTRLSVDRIYVRKGQKEFNSVSFNIQMDFNSPITGKVHTIKGRFWAKLGDVNTMEVKLV